MITSGLNIQNSNQNQDQYNNNKNFTKNWSEAEKNCDGETETKDMQVKWRHTFRQLEIGLQNCSL